MRELFPLPWNDSVLKKKVTYSTILPFFGVVDPKLESFYFINNLRFLYNDYSNF